MDSNAELESFNSGLGPQDNIEEINNLRQMREAIAEPKKNPENKTKKKSNGNKKSKTKGEKREKKKRK